MPNVMQVGCRVGIGRETGLSEMRGLAQPPLALSKPFREKMMRMKRVLIYKRTHTGDPDRRGQFGIHDCMGRVRARKFDAVIGIGGISAEPRSHNIDRRINWIGIGPHKSWLNGRRGPVVVFDHFILLESNGPHLEELAPQLARHMYRTNRRHVMSNRLSGALSAEIKKILALGLKEPRSPVWLRAGAKNGRRSSPGSCAKPKAIVAHCPPNGLGTISASSCGKVKTKKKCR